MKTFRVPLIRKILSLLALLMVLSLTGFVTYLCVQEFDVFTRILEGRRSGFFVLFGLLVLVALTIKFVVYFMAVLNAQLIFDDKRMTIEAISGPGFLLWRGLKPFSIELERVRSVFFNLLGMLEIIDAQGKRYAFSPGLFSMGSGEDILLELKSRVPPRVLAPILENSENFKHTHNWVFIRSLAFPVILMLHLLTMYLEPPNSELIHVWKSEMRLSWLEDVEGYSVDPSGGFWVLSDTFAGYRVYRFLSSPTQSWKWNLELFETQYPKFVSGDAEGTPVIWLENGMMRYVNKKWEIMPYKENLVLESDRMFEAITEGHVLVLNGNAGQLLNINVSNGEWYALTLPQDARQNRFVPASIKRTVDGEILVLMKNDRESRVYLLSNGEWSSHEYAIIQADGRVRDYFLDEDGVLWVLLSIRGQSIVERLDNEGNVSVTRLPSMINKVDAASYSSLRVDSSGRLWVEGKYPRFISVFAPVWGGDVDEIIRYSVENSNYQSGISSSTVLMPDGKLWAFEKQVVSMDTNLNDLPAPLPDWFESLDLGVVRLILMMIFNILLITPSVVPMIYSLSFPVRKQKL